MESFACMFRAVTGMVLAALSMVTGAQEYPMRPVTIVVDYASGAATDVIVRALQPELQKALGQPVIVESVPGAGGSIGLSRVLNARNGGHTIYLRAASDVILTPMQVAGAKYQAENVALVGATAYTSLALIARPGLKVADADALIARLKATGGQGPELRIVRHRVTVPSCDGATAAVDEQPDGACPLSCAWRSVDQLRREPGGTLAWSLWSARLSG